MREQISNTGDSTVVVINKAKLNEIIANGSLEFDEWTSLISEVEKSYPDSIEDIRLVYDSFLSEFPLCYGYWRKYVNHNIRLSTIDKVVQVFERAVLSATYSVDLWVDYCDFGTLSFEDPSDVRSFKKLVEVWETEMESCSNCSLTELVELMPDTEASIHYNHDDIICIIKKLLDPSIGSARSKVLQNYKAIGELFFQEASKLNEKISYFETRIKRPYFHVKPLNASQLENWNCYLNFAELHGDFDWAVKLYERCLIPCANYPEFWMRYVEFMESKGGREIANLALDRATQIFLKRVSVIHLFNARFKEHIGDVSNAHASFLRCSKESDLDFVENVVIRSNMEKRLGNFIAASTIYKEAIEMAAKMEKWHILSILYVHFSRLKYMTTDSEDTARDILIDGIKHVPHCKLLIEELIKFATTHGGSRHMNVIDTIVANAISPGTSVSQGLSAKDGEDISRLYLEFVDLCGTVNDVRKAWHRHVKLFPSTARTALFHPAMGTTQWKIDMEEEETLVNLPHQLSGDSSSHCLIQSSLEEKKLSSPQINDTQVAHPATDQKLPLLTNHDMLPNRAAVQESPLSENHREHSDQENVDVLQSGESDNIIHEVVCPVPLKVSEPSGDVIKPKCQGANRTENMPASLEFSKEHDVEKEFGQESEQDLKPPSLERLSLDPQDSKSPSPISPVSDDYGAPRNTSLSDEGLQKSELAQRHSTSNETMLETSQNVKLDPSISSIVSIPATVSAEANHGYASPSSSASNQNVMAQAFPQPQNLANIGRNWHQKSNSDRFRRDSKFRFRGHSHKRLYKQRQTSPQRTYQRTENGSQMPMNQDYQSQCQSSQNPQVKQGGQVQSQYPASTVHTNLTVSQGWSMHNLQQQNLPPACQSQPAVQPVLYPQPQMSQNPIQNNEQQGVLQNNQSHNQMWQHYYYQQQQQQILWQQQQLLQHQQPQQQQQLLQQQYQHQLLQMQYLQQQQGPQLQQQQLPYQQQQLQQLQQQQEGQLQQQPQQLLQQQSYQQQHLVNIQQQQQLGLQQPQHQQLQLQLQQQHYQQLQTPSMQQRQHEQEQGQPKHQMNISQVQD
ncbi:pre-mRNA-processing factor 39-2 isoform X3 [Ricinus communis]|uniref:pre-mRNA-processing factor 39-2 isoform X3 n=1 Tax=Ricinus communis TaxID=3988 RepID=UPI00201A9234|nr:pre-mRNA-processing factor 39-2 isoform X3 [Ricinus communis]